ncbi:CvpA family protein [Martelella sp. AD-3]|uniref:CvpA family protein n=1 Tax=Martelella sp. AD-3 TaxID=686597 RepID=UPI000467CA8E|nr:CvpA family protein [Martelella sp. AD-3]AMM84725.1 colicin V production protein [Martelella sp. AD-3]MAM10248.1 colicin V production protein [Rhizobiaceae bacterium]
MPVTLFDLIVLGVVLFSALLAMVRGFSREILSLLAWGLSAAIAYVGYPFLAPTFEGFLDDPRMSMAGAFAVIFLIALVLLSLVTTRFADYIIDSRAGVLDRSLGFVFGLVRGVLILAVAVAFWNWLVGDAQSPDWIRNAKSKPALDMLAAKLESYLPGGGELESSLDRDQRRLLAMIDGNVILKFRPDARPI